LQVFRTSPSSTRILTQRKSPFERENILFVGNNLQTSSNYIKRILPNAIFILFTTTLVPETVSVYGNLIASYSLKQAIEDKRASPVQYEIRSLDLLPKTLLTDVETSSEEPFRNHLTLERISAIAADLVQHFEARSTNQHDKVVVITSRIDNANQLLQSIQHIRPNWAERGVVFALSSLLTNKDRQNLLTRFSDPQDPFRIAIVSSTLLPLIETANVKTAYLANTLPKNAVKRTIALVSRRSKEESGLVVDYNNNLTVIEESYELEQ
jgi:type I restriction enzyme R subunit